jgi:predicted nucleic acid-binding protein
VGGLFLDTAGWFAAITPRETGHAKAKKTYSDAARAGDRLVTTPLVIAEMHAMLLRWASIDSGQRFLTLVFETGTHTVVDTDADVIRAAVTRWVKRFADKPFSLCDAVSFEVMRRERITRALTYDKHFSIAGFDTLR